MSNTSKPIALGLAIAIAIAATGCRAGASASGGGGRAVVTSPAGPSTAATPPGSTSPRPVTLADAADCPVTVPGEPPPGVSADEFFGYGASYGNGVLWVGGLWPKGVIAAGAPFVEDDGSVGMKFGWWRAAAGDLEITGRRLDGPAPAVRADVPEGYGTEGFQASGVSFPTEGCWEVTGTLGSSTLTFVTFVVKRR